MGLLWEEMKQTIEKGIDQRPSRSPWQLPPSILTFPTTDKQLFLLKHFHLPSKAVSRSPTPGSPPWVSLLIDSPEPGHLDKKGCQQLPSGLRNKGQMKPRKSNLQCMQKSVPVGARGHRTRWKVSQYMMRGWKAAAPRVR